MIKNEKKRVAKQLQIILLNVVTFNQEVNLSVIRWVHMTFHQISRRWFGCVLFFDCVACTDHRLVSDALKKKQPPSICWLSAFEQLCASIIYSDLFFYLFVFFFLTMWYNHNFVFFYLEIKSPMKTKNMCKGPAFPSTITLYCLLWIGVAKYPVCQWWLWCDRLVPSDSDPQGQGRWRKSLSFLWLAAGLVTSGQQRGEKCNPKKPKKVAFVSKQRSKLCIYFF